MRHSSQKRRDIIRGLLPSKARKMARHLKSHSNRKARHRANQAIRMWEDESDLVMGLHQADQTLKRDIRLAVRERREADKLRPFLRWAKAHTCEFEEEDEHSKYYKIKSLLNGAKDIISYHALGHFSDKASLNPFYGRSILGYYGYKPSWQKKDVFPEGLFSKLLEEAYILDHRGLNQVLKSLSLSYKRCELGEDSCMEVQTQTRRVWRYKLRSQYGVRTSTVRPLEGPDLVWAFQMTETKSEVVHHWLQCHNRVLVFGYRDLERIESRLKIDQLLDFFKRKGLLS